METIKRLRLLGRFYWELLFYNLAISLFIEIGVIGGETQFKQPPPSAEMLEKLFVSGFLSLFIGFGFLLACLSHYRMQRGDYYFYYNARLSRGQLWLGAWLYNLCLAWILYQIYILKGLYL